MTASLAAPAPTLTPSIEQRIAEQLALLYSEAHAMEWLQTPQQILAGQIPARAIAAGKGEEVLRELRAVNEGAYL